MKKLALLMFAIFTILACKKNTKIETPIKESPDKPILETACYEYNSDGNHITMEITEIDSKVMANLNIAYAEKDRNQGKFVGDLNGDKLIGTYTFNSEGTESSREIAFLIKDNQIIEGYGEMNEEGTKFKDTSSITYPATMPLLKVDCTK